MGFGLVFSASCNLQETNVNPNAVSEVTPNVTLPSAQANMAWAITDFTAQSTSSLLQYLTGTLNVQYNVTTYDYLPVNFQTPWNSHFYAGAMVDLRNIIEQAEADGSPYYSGIAKIQMGMLLGYIVDFWGDAPYSQAFQLDEFPQPQYDSGEELYEEMFRLYESGIQDLQAEESALIPTFNDRVYPASNTTNWAASSRAQWIAAAHALRARYYNHYSKLDPEGSANNALQAIADGAFTSAADEMSITFGDSELTTGPWYGFLLGTFGQNNIAVSQEIIDKLENRVGEGINDPRLPYYVEENSSGEFVGAPVGSSSIPSNASRIGPYIRSIGTPTYIMTYSELKFIEAEAYLRLSQFANAATAYNEAVIASLEQVTGNADEAYVATFASETAASIQEDGMEKIFTEKYIAMYLQAEAWTDWRRSIPAGADGTTSGIPNLEAAPGNLSGGVFPRRFLYPTSELDNNAANVPETSRFARVFWDL